MTSDSEKFAIGPEAGVAGAAERSALAAARRDFLVRAGEFVGGGWLALNAPVLMAAAHDAVARRDAQAGWVNLSEAEAATTAALVDRIFPPDDQPGAAEIGVVYFVDQALGGFLAERADVFRSGLTDLEQRAAERSEGGGFAALPPDVKDELLAAVESTPFFGMALMMTHAGLFALPSWGGNRGKAGWAIVGFDDRHAWQPPFGFYDAQAMQEADRDAG